MGATPESAGITAQPRLRYLRVRALSNWCFFWMNLKWAGELFPRKPDSCEIHPTSHRDRYLPTEKV